MQSACETTLACKPVRTLQGLQTPQAALLRAHIIGFAREPGAGIPHNQNAH